MGVKCSRPDLNDKVETSFTNSWFLAAYERAYAMNMFEEFGNSLLQQHEGNQQLASALADGVRVLMQRLRHLLSSTLRNLPGRQQRP